MNPAQTPAQGRDKAQAQPPVSALDIQRIMNLLPHRYPFLLVDRVVAYTPGQDIHAYKCVTFNEPFFQGHFPGLPVMPGVLIVEALAQAGGIMTLLSLPVEEVDNKLFLFTGIEKVRFRRPVHPGDRLELRCALLKHRLRLWRMSGHAYVDGVLAAEAELTAAITPRDEA